MVGNHKTSLVFQGGRLEQKLSFVISKKLWSIKVNCIFLGKVLMTQELVFLRDHLCFDQHTCQFSLHEK